LIGPGVVHRVERGRIDDDQRPADGV
jgi:hypothetical protein